VAISAALPLEVTVLSVIIGFNHEAAVGTHRALAYRILVKSDIRRDRVLAILPYSIC